MGTDDTTTVPFCGGVSFLRACLNLAWSLANEAIVRAKYCSCFLTFSSTGMPVSVCFSRRDSWYEGSIFAFVISSCSFLHQSRCVYLMILC